MNNKGFTLVELIVVIALVLVFAGIFSVNMTKGLQSQNKENEDKMISDLFLAADAYIHSTTTDLFGPNTKITISTKQDLIDQGFIKDNTAYPDQICATKSTTGNITFKKGACQ